MQTYFTPPASDLRAIIASRLAPLLLAALMLLALVPAATQPAAPRAQAQLLALGQSQPNSIVQIIAQKASPTSDLSARVAALGGTITSDLHIINAVAAQLTARAAIELARAAEVAWVSLDSPVFESGAAQRPAGQTSACADTGSITREYWLGVSGYDTLYVPTNTKPSGSDTLTSLEAPSNWGDGFGDRIRGYLCPPTSGTYTFWIASDVGRAAVGRHRPRLL